MILKTKTAYPYHNEGQVKNCVAQMLGISPEECQAQLVTSIGWNGENFISSTDWKIQTPDGIYALPPAMVPQYETYVALYGGMNIKINSETKKWRIGYDNKEAIVHMLDSSLTFNFLPGERIEMPYAADASKILLSDCLVTLVETKWTRNFFIEEDEAVYGEFLNGTFWPV